MVSNHIVQVGQNANGIGDMLSALLRIYSDSVNAFATQGATGIDQTVDGLEHCL